MSISTLEDLPDEILMTIFSYSDSIVGIFRAFIGLNHRLNRILVDQQVHLLTDYVSLKSVNIHYQSDCFEQVKQHILSIKTSINEIELRQILQPIISYSVEQKLNEIKKNYELLRDKFVLTRRNLSSEQVQQVDDELKHYFCQLENQSVTIKSVQQIKQLVLSKGARLDCDNYELSGFNLATALTNWITEQIVRNDDEQLNMSMNFHSKILEYLLISNPDLVNNRQYIGNGGLEFDDFLFYTFFHLKPYFFYSKCPTFVNTVCFQMIFHFVLLTFNIRLTINPSQTSIQRKLIHAINSNVIDPNDDYIRICQIQILQLVFQRNDIEQIDQDEFDYEFSFAFKNLLQTKRLDLIKHLSRQATFQRILSTSNFAHQCLNSIDRQTFFMLINDLTLKYLFPPEQILFILLKKKQRQLLKKFFQVFSDRINQHDEYGNNALMYIALNVSGCRHRIIEMLIKAGCNTQGINNNGQSFIDILKLPRNHKLVTQLIQHEIIDI